MRVLVTGNLGYIGSVLTPMLAERGHEVWGYDTGYYKNCLLMQTGNSGVVKQIAKDIRDVDPDDLAGIDAIIHLAALSNDPMGELNPSLTNDINFMASTRLAQAAKAAGVRRLVFASSCSIYGQSDAAALTEESTFNPQTAYAHSKVNTEAALSELADDNFSPVFMRNATAYGLSPRLRFDLAVNNLTGWGVTTGEVKLLSDGRAWRPMVHIEDLSAAAIAALTAARDVIHNQAFNVGSETENYQIRSIAEMVSQIVPDTKVTFAEGVGADNRTYNVSFKKIREALPEFQPIWTVEKGIRQLHEALCSVGITHEGFEGRDFTRLKQLRFLLETGKINDQLRWIS